MQFYPLPKKESEHSIPVVFNISANISHGKNYTPILMENCIPTSHVKPWHLLQKAGAVMAYIAVLGNGHNILIYMKKSFLRCSPKRNFSKPRKAGEGGLSPPDTVLDCKHLSGFSFAFSSTPGILESLKTSPKQQKQANRESIYSKRQPYLRRVIRSMHALVFITTCIIVTRSNIQYEKEIITGLKIQL